MKIVEIPEDALAALLVKAGVEQAPAQFLAMFKAQLASGRKFQKRAKAAFGSTFWLGFSALFSLVSFLISPNIEDFLGAVLLGGMTVVEIHVRKWFLEFNPKACKVGFWNQSLFAVLFLVYGAYHAMVASVPPALMELAGPEFSDAITAMSRITYGGIGIVCAACQFGLGLYYLTAARK